MFDARTATAVRATDAAPLLAFGIEEPTPESGWSGLSERSLTIDRIDSLVKAYVAEHKIDFNFADIRSTGISVAKSRDHLADVWFRHEFYKPALVCKLDWDGRILEIHVGNARLDE